MCTLRGVLLSILLCCLAGSARAAEPVDYARDVQPLLQSRCYQCHGPEKHKGGFRADSKSIAFAATDSGERPIVPGDVEKSHLLKLVTSTDDDERMPPKGERLTKEQIDLLTRWIKQGASWPDAPTAPAPVAKSSHWAFNKPAKHEAPAVKDAAWARNAIDRFILAAQDKQGLHPSPEADKYALIRRATFDLTGLPPTPHEIAQFIADTAPDAYDRLIDRLLASPAYGERWARVWMDIARYADSAGLGSDPLRHTAWPYRDWVIRACNSNMPFDRFTVEQLAGDLLPNATRDQIIATGFHRNTMTNTEGGTDDEEWRVAAVKDRTNVTVQAWMGLTMGCAECHTHKYDPITNKEYYSFFAFFNETEDNDQPNESPTMPVPTGAQERKQAQIKAQIAKVQAEIDEPGVIAAKQAEWESAVRSESSAWTVLQPSTMTSSGGATLTKQPDGSILASGAHDNRDVYTITAATELKDITAFRIEALPDESLPAKGPGRGGDGNFVLNDFKVGVRPAGEVAKSVRGRFVRLELSGEKRMIHIAELQAFSGEENAAIKGAASQSSTAFDGLAARAIDGNTDGVFANGSVNHTAVENDPWWEVDLRETRELSKLVVWPRADGSALFSRLDGLRVSILDENRKPVWTMVLDRGPRRQTALNPSDPSLVSLKNATATFSQSDYNVAEAIDGNAREKSGWAIAPQFGAVHAASFEPTQDVNVDGGAKVLTFTLTQNAPMLSMGRFRISATTSQRPVRVLPGDVTSFRAIAPAQRTPAQAARVTAYFKSVAPFLSPKREELAKLNKQLSEINPPQVAIMRELPADKRRKTTVLVKGNFMAKGDAVEPTVPAAFNPLPKDAPHNRLGVALWLVDKDNPLTSRVAVNRFWAVLFGSCIVLNQEDFVTLGQPPTHPELLDTLAVTFRDEMKWDVKAMLKLIMTSATYRQSSRITPELLEKDPTNRWLTRSPRLRLEAEAVRDQALALSGLLSAKMFGPSVYPPQPAGLWQAAFNGERNYPTSSGEDKYRRGLYTFWRRTVPYPSMKAFDAPSREQCVVRRIHTSTPIQAFVTLNDPVYVECSQALGRRIAKEGGATTEERAAWALKLCLARPASAEQVTTIVTLYESELATFRKDAEAAKAMATEPIGPLPAGQDPAEIAAWTVVSNVLLNLDGVLTKS
jgi:mono/diheme cytochrome c family protein